MFMELPASLFGDRSLMGDHVRRFGAT